MTISKVSISGKKNQATLQAVSRVDKDYSLGMDKVGKSVRLWWPESIGGILSSERFAGPSLLSEKQKKCD